jgi:hypothetical protein
MNDRKSGNVVNIGPWVPDTRDIIRDPKGHFANKAAEWRALAEQLRRCPPDGGMDPREVAELADDLDKLADKMEAFPDTERSKSS